jgi:hypothetical protein
MPASRRAGSPSPSPFPFRSKGFPVTILFDNTGRKIAPNEDYAKVLLETGLYSKSAPAKPAAEATAPAKK